MKKTKLISRILLITSTVLYLTSCGIENNDSQISKTGLIGKQFNSLDSNDDDAEAIYFINDNELLIHVLQDEGGFVSYKYKYTLNDNVITVQKGSEENKYFLYNGNLLVDYWESEREIDYGVSYILSNN